MLQKTRAIVLHKSNYSETSLVVQVFTLDFGKVSLLVRGAKRKKSQTKSALFEPLSIIDLVGNFNSLDKLVTPREIKLSRPFVSIQSSMVKRAMVLFVSEILNKCITEPHPEPGMFLFVENSLTALETSNTNQANFHVVFLLQLATHLGFKPQKSQGNYFDMLEGVFTNSIPSNNMYLEGEEKNLFLQVLGTEIESSDTLNITAAQRKQLLTALIKYYQTHIPNMGEIKSYSVLESIFI